MYFAFLKYFYTSTIDVSAEVATLVADLMNLYDEPVGKRICEGIIRTKLTVENSLEILQHTDDLRMTELKEFTKNWIFRNFTKVTQTEGFRDFVLKSGPLAYELLQGAGKVGVFSY